MKRVDHRGEEPDELASALVDKFTACHIHHLADILDADPRSLDEYYGEDSRDFGDKARIAGQICPQNEEAVAQLLTLKDNHFGRKKINRTAVVEYLSSEGVPVETMEEMGAKDLLLAAYQTFFDTEAGEMPEREVNRLVARGTLFEDRRDRMYFYEERELPLDEIDKRIDKFRRRYNRRNRKALDIRMYEDEAEKRVVLHLFQERPRQVQYVFSKRVGDDEPGPPSVTTAPNYPVKAIRLRLQNRDGVGELRLSKSAENNGWTGVLEDLMEDSFGVSKALDDARKHRSEKVDQIVSSAVETASQSEDEENAEDDESESVEEVISTKISEAVDEAVEAREKSDEERGFNAEELRERANFDPVGFRVKNGEVIEEIELTAQTTLKDALDREPGVRDMLESQLSDADSDVTVGIKCRATLPDGRVETFVLEDGMPRPAHSGLSREMQHVLNAVFDDESSDN